MPYRPHTHLIAMEHFVKTPLVIAAALSTLVPAALADALPGGGLTLTPNLYELVHPKGGLIYATDPATGEPMRFAYRDQGMVFETDGSGIRREKTELGEQISVDLKQIPDLRTTTLTLTLPRVNLIANDLMPPEPAAIPRLFTTYATITTHRTSIAGPDLVTGQVDLYGLRQLIGKAQHGTDEAPARTSLGVIGRVILQPTCPVEEAGKQPCTGPYAGAEVLMTNDETNALYSTVTDERGLFAIEAVGGSYTVSVNVQGALPNCQTAKVIIPEVVPAIFPWPETREYLQLSCDTGLR